MKDRYFKRRKGRHGKSKIKSMKTLPEVLAEVQALSSAPEDQFESLLATAVADLQVLVDAAPAAVTATSVTITFSDESTQTLPGTSGE